LRAAVVGLGSGSLACYFKEGDTFDFYEIDQSIVDLATDPGYFTYYSSCAPDANIIVGDARLTMTDARDGAYDIIIVDAFTSDAIPIHLMTKEAMATYLAKLAPRGIVVLHISNRHMELGSVVAGIAKENGLTTRIYYKEIPEEEDSDKYMFSSTVTASARSPEDFGSLAQGENAWEDIEPDPKQWVWTDDYSNVIGAMIRHMNE
jgi:spermidine synthase